MQIVYKEWIKRGFVCFLWKKEEKKEQVYNNIKEQGLCNKKEQKEK